MTNLGFDNYIEPLRLYLKKFREVLILILFILYHIIQTNIYNVI